MKIYTRQQWKKKVFFWQQNASGLTKVLCMHNLWDDYMKITMKYVSLVWLDITHCKCHGSFTAKSNLWFDRQRHLMTFFVHFVACSFDLYFRGFMAKLSIETNTICSFFWLNIWYCIFDSINIKILGNALKRSNFKLCELMQKTHIFL